jgi:hypothetical protein
VKGGGGLDNERKYIQLKQHSRREYVFPTGLLRFFACRHNLDSMHIEKNVFENIINTLLDVKKRSKHNAKARIDMNRIKIREHLHIDETQEKPELQDALHYMDT